MGKAGVVIIARKGERLELSLPVRSCRPNSQHQDRAKCAGVTHPAKADSPVPGRQ